MEYFFIPEMEITDYANFVNNTFNIYTISIIIEEV